MFSAVTGMIRGLAKRRLARQPGVQIAPDAKVAFERISFRPRSTLRIGEASIVEAAVIFDREGAEVVVGRNTFIGGAMLVAAERIEIGDDVLMAWGGTIVDHDSHSLNWNERADDVRDWYRGRKDWTHVVRKPVRVGNKAWVGFNVAILKGVSIGEGAIVAACAVVTRDVPPYTLVAGNPARIVRALEPGERPVEAK